MSSVFELKPVNESAEALEVQELQVRSNQLLFGRGANRGAFTALNATTSTVVNDNRFESFQTVCLSPLTANAAGLAAWISSRGTGTFTVSHNLTTGDEDFEYIFCG